MLVLVIRSSSSSRLPQQGSSSSSSGQGGRQGQALCHFPPSELVPHGVERGRKPSRPPRRGYCRCRSLRPPRHACGGVLCRAGEVLCLAVEVLYLSVVVFCPVAKCFTLW